MTNKKYVLALAGIVLAGATTFGVLSALGEGTPEPDSTCLVGTVDCNDADLGAEPGDTPADPTDQTCPVGTVDCNDADLGGERLDGDAIEEIEQAAYGLLGRNESDLPEDVRVGRRGTEVMALTEDFVIGRLTVALDDTDGSGFRVVEVTAELPNGVATYELTAG